VAFLTKTASYPAQNSPQTRVSGVLVSFKVIFHLRTKSNSDRLQVAAGTAAAIVVCVFDCADQLHGYLSRKARSRAKVLSGSSTNGKCPLSSIMTKRACGAYLLYSEAYRGIEIRSKRPARISIGIFSF
jgi:hypothetical protein